MKIETKLKVNEVIYSFEIEERDDMEALHKAIVISNPPTYCHCCKNDKDFKFDSNKDSEGNIYVNIVCKSCFAKAKLGRYKTSGFFWHKFEKYVKEVNKEN